MYKVKRRGASTVTSAADILQPDIVGSFREMAADPGSLSSTCPIVPPAGTASPTADLIIDLSFILKVTFFLLRTPFTTCGFY